MKRLIIILVAGLALSMSGLSQPVVKGVTVEGNERDVTASLMVAGLDYLGANEEQGFNCLKGDFAGIANCDVNVFYNRLSKDVYLVSVGLPLRKTWSELKADYSGLLSSYKDKYGKPYEFSASFEFPHNSPGMEMQGVLAGGCNYSAEWKGKGFRILLTICEDGSVIVGYYNTKAYAEMKKAVSEDI